MDMFQSTKVDILDLIKDFLTSANNSSDIEELRVILSIIFLPLTLPLFIPCLLINLVKIPASLIFHLYYSIFDWFEENYGILWWLILAPLLIWFVPLHYLIHILIFLPLDFIVSFIDLFGFFLALPFFVCIEMIKCKGTKYVDEIISEIDYDFTFPIDFNEKLKGNK
jgi:hypothetical protein